MIIASRATGNQTTGAGNHLTQRKRKIFGSALRLFISQKGEYDVRYIVARVPRAFAIAVGHSLREPV